MQLISSRENNLIKETQKLVKSASKRHSEGLYVIEGVRLCSDAVLSNVVIYRVFFSQSAAVKFKDLLCTLEEICESVYILTDKLFSQISDTKTPQGVMCVCKMANVTIPFGKKDKYLCLEQIQDPSNLGTMLRTAEALGINGIILSKDCCDIYSPKVLRGAMGAVFRLPVMIAENFTDIIKALKQKGVNTIAAVPHSGAVKITMLSHEDKSPCALFIGNEGNGLSEETINICDMKITIPMKGRAESLNASAAASIAMWEILK